MESNPLNNILVIDVVPTIALGLQEVLRPLNNSATIAHVENIFAALSSKQYEGIKFELIIIGDQAESPLENLPRVVAECKNRFGNSRIMIYTPNYDHALIERMTESGI